MAHKTPGALYKAKHALTDYLGEERYSDYEPFEPATPFDYLQGGQPPSHTPTPPPGLTPLGWGWLLLSGNDPCGLGLGRHWVVCVYTTGGI